MPITSASSPTSSVTASTSPVRSLTSPVRSLTSPTTTSISSLSCDSVRFISANNSSFVISKSEATPSIAVCKASSRDLPSSRDANNPVASLDSSTSVSGLSATDGEPTICFITLNVAVGR